MLSLDQLNTANKQFGTAYYNYCLPEVYIGQINKRTTHNALLKCLF